MSIQQYFAKENKKHEKETFENFMQGKINLKEWAHAHGVNFEAMETRGDEEVPSVIVWLDELFNLVK